MITEVSSNSLTPFMLLQPLCDSADGHGVQ